MSTDSSGALNGRTVYLTGGSTGIGRATAILLAKVGCEVVFCGETAQHVEDATAAAQDAGVSIRGVTVDLGTTGGVKEFFDAAQRTVGKPDIVILNAGIAESGKLEEMDEASCRAVIDVNLTGYILCAMEALKAFDGSKGQIVLIGSLSAEARKPESTVYVASKCGVRGFATSLRKEVNPAGIKVLLIEPGSVGTDMQDEGPEEQRKKEAAGEMLMAEDIARAVAYVAAEPQRSSIIELQIRPTLQLI